MVFTDTPYRADSCDKVGRGLRARNIRASSTSSCVSAGNGPTRYLLVDRGDRVLSMMPPCVVCGYRP